MCTQCIIDSSTVNILGVYRRTLQRVGITRHPHALPLDAGPNEVIATMQYPHMGDEEDDGDWV